MPKKSTSTADKTDESDLGDIRRSGKDPLLPSSYGVIGQNCPEEDGKPPRRPEPPRTDPTKPNGEDGDAPYITGR